MTPEDYIMDDLCLKIRCAVCALLCSAVLRFAMLTKKYLGYFYCILLSIY